MAKSKSTKSLKSKTTRRKRRPDEAILQLAERRAELRTQQAAQPDAAVDRRGNALHRLECAIINQPTESLAGLRVTRILAEEQIISIHDRVPSVKQAYRQSHRMFEDRLAFSIWADAERLAEKGGAS